MPGQLGEQRIQGGLPHDAQLPALQCANRVGDHAQQHRLLTQNPGERRLAMVGRVLEQRPELALDPLRLQVQHRISEAALGRRVAVMNLPRLQQKHLPRRTAVQHLAAIELLYALFGEADQVTLVKVWVVGMAFEMGTDGLDAGLAIPPQINPVVRAHGNSAKRSTLFRQVMRSRRYSRSWAAEFLEYLCRRQGPCVAA